MSQEEFPSTKVSTLIAYIDRGFKKDDYYYFLLDNAVYKRHELNRDGCWSTEHLIEWSVNDKPLAIVQALYRNDRLSYEFERELRNTGVDLDEGHKEEIVTQSQDHIMPNPPVISSTRSAKMPEYKRRVLEQRHAQLVEEYEAVMNQLSNTLGAGDAVKLKRQAEALEAEISDIEEQLGLNPTKVELKSEKASPGSASAPNDAHFGTGDRWAVLVGVNQYTDPTYPQLRVCVKDVEAIHQQLLDAGYDPARVRLLTDDTDPLPTRAKVLSAMMVMAKAAARDDLVLFYYSGHGDVLDGKSYLVAREGEAVAPEYTAIALDEVAEILRGSEARAKVIILDACHSGANFEGKGPKSMPPEFIERVFKQAKGQVVLASCEQGQFSYEWQAQERSVFTHFLLEALAGEADFDYKQLISVQDVNRYVSNGVRKWAFQHGKTQTPTLQGAMAGDIILVQL